MRLVLGLVAMALLLTTLGACGSGDHRSTAPPPGGVSVGTDPESSGKGPMKPPPPKKPPPLENK
jgi:hypothetical protein